MTKTIKQGLTSKWILVMEEYEKIKNKRSKHFEKVGEMCEAYKVNRKDIRHYYKRWIESGKERESLLPRKRGPKPGRMKKLSKDEERMIISIKRKLQANEFEIFHMIQSYFQVPPSVSTIYRTMKRYPLNKKNIEKIKRYEKKYPGELEHCDMYCLDRTLFKDDKKRFLFGIIDDCTRLCYVEILNENKAYTVTEACVRGQQWLYAHGVRAKEIMTDNGSEFTAYTSQKTKHVHFFETMLRIFGVTHRYTQPYRPQTNGKIERFWRTIYTECIQLQKKTLTKEELQLELNAFMDYYNYSRRHSALNYNTPLDKLISVTEILK